jgi:hypothetical protein
LDGAKSNEKEWNSLVIITVFRFEAVRKLGGSLGIAVVSLIPYGKSQ